jgi:hypothetical protein
LLFPTKPLTNARSLLALCASAISLVSASSLLTLSSLSPLFFFFSLRPLTVRFLRFFNSSKSDFSLQDRQLLYSACLLSPVRVVKFVRLRDFSLLLPICGLRVVHLIRDPRAVLASQLQEGLSFLSLSLFTRLRNACFSLVEVGKGRGGRANCMQSRGENDEFSVSYA